MPRYAQGRRLGAVLSLTAVILPALAADSAPPADISEQALEILKRSIAFRTAAGEGQVPAYAGYLAGVLRAGGFVDADIEITPYGETATLLARYRGREPDAGAIVIGAHMDVVPALAEDWERDPYVPVIEDGFVFGRGATDNKFGIASMVAALLWLKQEGFRPQQDIVLALTGDEETSQETTAILAGKLKDAEMFLNSDAGGAYLDDSGKPVLFGMQAAEKTYMDFEVSFTDPGGHSSRPDDSNPIHDLARAVTRIAGFRFPARVTELTTEYFRTAGRVVGGEIGAAMQRYAENPADRAAYELLAAQPEYVGQLGTTCVATTVRAGHAPNALPQSARVNINCRVFPGESVESVRETLVRVIGDPGATVKVVGSPVPSDPSPLREDVMKALRKALDLRAPGLPIVPTMSAGATDGLYFRNAGVPSYGVGGIFMHPKDNFAHGLNERVPVDSMDGAIVQWASLIRELSR